MPGLEKKYKTNSMSPSANINQTLIKMSNVLANQILHRLKEQLHKEDLQCDELSSRELFITKLIAKGYTPKEAADYLCLSPETITTHLKNIYGKLGIHRQPELVAWYFRQLFKGNGK